MNERKQNNKIGCYHVTVLPAASPIQEIRENRERDRVVGNRVDLECHTHHCIWLKSCERKWDRIKIGRF
jgi:hypothetical protein